MESIFTPGMRTRVHSHPGPEAFYVVDGEQCVETPKARQKLRAGDTFIVAPGPHVQAAAKGRRNLTLALYPAGSAWMTLETSWTPSQFCAD
jgi:quercetin dioxygenase-like cupin family protein